MKCGTVREGDRWFVSIRFWGIVFILTPAVSDITFKGDLLMYFHPLLKIILICGLPKMRMNGNILKQNLTSFPHLCKYEKINHFFTKIFTCLSILIAWHYWLSICISKSVELLMGEIPLIIRPKALQIFRHKIIQSVINLHICHCHCLQNTYSEIQFHVVSSHERKILESYPKVTQIVTWYFKNNWLKR